MRAFYAAFLSASFGLSVSLGLAGPSWGQSQPPPPPRPNGLVFHVAMAGTTPTVSLGMAQPATAGALLRQRREMQADCTWAQAADLSVPADSIVPLRNPAQMGGPDGFGVYYATLFSALVSAKGGTPTADQQGCIRRTMTFMASNLMRQQGGAPGAAPSGSGPQAGAPPQGGPAGPSPAPSSAPASPSPLYGPAPQPSPQTYAPVPLNPPR